MTIGCVYCGSTIPGYCPASPDGNCHIEELEEPEGDFEPEVYYVPYGYCPNCGDVLVNMGTESDDGGTHFDKIGCLVCDEVILKIHAAKCQCTECLSQSSQQETPTP